MRLPCRVCDTDRSDHTSLSHIIVEGYSKGVQRKHPCRKIISRWLLLERTLN